MSRRLFTTSSAVAQHPIAAPQSTAARVRVVVWTYAEPAVATNPKNTNTNSSPNPA
jgi:hypothetical protein